jgi:hypothetical protein
MDDEIFALMLQLSIDDTYRLSFGTSDLDIVGTLQREKIQDYLGKKGGSSKVLSSTRCLATTLAASTRYKIQLRR